MRMRGFIAVFSALLLAACTTTTRVVREEPAPAVRTLSTVPPDPAMHRVQAGETLYGIAFRHRLDWRSLAAWNGIAEPFVIRPGQLLRLSPPQGERPRVAAAEAVRPPPPTATRPASRPDPGAGLPAPPPIPRGLVGQTPPTRAVAGAPAAVTAPAATSTAAPVAAAAPAANAPPAAPTAVAGGGAAFRPGQWQWPTEGQVVARFAEGDRSRQGIAIAGTAGQAVRAAAAGTVVYSGAGLVGFGELIIIKHDDQWLSAYGHNRRRLVAEGASVQAGQQIAELGRTGTSRDMLHFEIRRSGRPVDPLPLLPQR